ncbi:MAG: hypothetical protein AABX84_02515, partial [Nanoarchaeota archaeon]
MLVLVLMMGWFFFGGTPLYDKNGKLSPKVEKEAKQRSKIIAQLLGEDGKPTKSNKLEDMLVTE